MIKEIPTPADFRQTGLDYLNLAWDAVEELTFQFEHGEELYVEEDDVESPDVESEYWSAAQRPISTAVTLAHQGAEFMLKSLISETSPFLLIAGNPSSWPENVTINDTPFAAFRTIDAQDLVRVHDSVSVTRLTPEFVQRFDVLRKKRNSVMHTVDRQLRLTVLDVFRDVLEISHHLTGAHKWPATRRRYLESCAYSVAYSTEHVNVRMARDFIRLANALSPSEVSKYFGIDKKQRRYFCCDCQMEDWDDPLDARSAVLRPNTPKSTEVYCFICGSVRKVVRRHCSNPDCKGNVIETGNNTCLTCLESGT
jgi:RNase P subunit RPR2